MRVFIGIAIGSLIGLGSGCDTGDVGPADEVGSVATVESALACSDAPEDIGGGVAVMLGCSFGNHLYNILEHGHALADLPVRDLEGRIVAHARAGCERYLLATDGDGVDVIIDSETGAVTSHGMLHAGQATSLLPAALPVPLELEQR